MQFFCYFNIFKQTWWKQKLNNKYTSTQFILFSSSFFYLCFDLFVTDIKKDA